MHDYYSEVFLTVGRRMLGDVGDQNKLFAIKYAWGI